MAFVAICSFVIPFVLASAFTKLAIRWAPRFGLVDRPSGRKTHREPTPLGGGLAIFLAIAFSLLGVLLLAWATVHFPSIARRLPEIAHVHAPGVLYKADLLALLLGLSGLQTLVGLLDDGREGGIDYRLRLAIEVGLVGVLISQGVRATIFEESAWINGLVTVVWIVGLTNALNFLDNMDGLSAGVAFWSAAFFAVVMGLLGDLFVAGCFLTSMGACLGFLRFNWSPAKIFMGDAGANFLGFWLGTLTVIGTFHADPYDHVTMLAPLCILAVPIYDGVSVVTLRILQGRSPFRPDRQHFSHRLVELGFRPAHAVLMIHLVSITTATSGLLLYFIPSYAGPIVLLQVVGMLLIVALLEGVARSSSNSVGEARS